MARWRLTGLLLVLLGGAGAACNEGSPLQRLGGSCPAGFATCDGANECVSHCVCEGGAFESCEQRCGDDGGPYVSQLDDGNWPRSAREFEAEVLALTNQARQKAGCCGDEGCFGASDNLALDSRLQRSARSHARDMVEQSYFDHNSLDGRSPFDRMREAGFVGCTMGENIAAGQPTPKSVVDDWLNSPGHCANIRQPAFKQVGVGFFQEGRQTSWVQNFGG